MPKDTPSLAKNKMRRSLAAIFDPRPSKAEVEELWAYFESRCAYCGTSINRDSRTGHLDHLVLSSEGGSNNVHNHALSCARCNGDEKREESWLSFLDQKAESPQVFDARKKKIENWLAEAPASSLSPENAARAEAIIERAIANFEESVEEMRALRRNGT